MDAIQNCVKRKNIRRNFCKLRLDQNHHVRGFKVSPVADTSPLDVISAPIFLTRSRMQVATEALLINVKHQDN
jgi:hypothetical protein